MRGFQAQGHNVLVVAPADDYSEQLSKEFHYERLNWLDRKGTNPLRDIMLCFELYRIYRKHKPDLIFQYTIKPNIYGSFAAFLFGQRPVCVVAGMGYAFTHKSSLTILAIALYRLAMMIAQKVVFLNEVDLSDFKRLQILPQNTDKALVFPSEGVDVNHFSKTKTDAVALSDPDRWLSLADQHSQAMVLIFVGRLLVDKGVRHFLQAARKIRQTHPNIKFQVLGSLDDGNPTTIQFSELKQYIESGDVDYLGAVTDVRPYISRADALVLPTSYGEGFSRVCLEALALGVPVISSDNRGCRNAVIHRKTGLTFSSAEPELLSNVIEEFICLPAEQRRIMGENGRKLVEENYSIEHVQKHYASLITEVVP